MYKEKAEKLLAATPLLRKIQQEQEVVWINPDKKDFDQAMTGSELSIADIDDAEARLERFAPFIMEQFPETQENGGLIESELVVIEKMKERFNKKYDSRLEGKLLLKKDSHLPIAGSVKARGGIYEVLKHTEDLAFEHGLLKKTDNYQKLASGQCKEFFGRYTIQVGSTGNLGLSIGIMSAVVGYQVIVHMSADARAWKKELLRSYGVKVVEYDADYSEAVKNGRKLSDQNPLSYFIDDENSRDLFLGYAVAAKRLQRQLEAMKISVDSEHPLFVYIPCGVGGAPGGVTFGLKQMYGEHVHCFFVEPTQSPCMLVGMASGMNNEISVQDIGLSGLTHADGLAVGRPSGFVGSVMKPLLSGVFTVSDANLYEDMRELLAAEEIFLEPSACAAFHGPKIFCNNKVTEEYLERYGLSSKLVNAVHIAWATGGDLVPEEVRKEYIATYL